MTKWRSESRDIKDLIPNPKNPRRMSKKQAKNLDKSLDKFGLCQPIVINTDNTVINGHQRLQTLQKLGHKQCSVFVADEPLSDTQKAELGLLLNKVSGDDDFDMLANLYDPEFLLECGFEADELGIDILPENTPDKNKKHKITITISHESDLLEIEKGVSEMLEQYPQAFYKVKAL